MGSVKRLETLFSLSESQPSILLKFNLINKAIKPIILCNSSFLSSSEDEFTAKFFQFTQNNETNYETPYALDMYINDTFSNQVGTIFIVLTIKYNNKEPPKALFNQISGIK